MGLSIAQIYGSAGFEGCRESDISRAHGVFRGSRNAPLNGGATAKRCGGNGKARHVMMGLKPFPQARGMQRESASVSLAMMVLSDNTHLAEHVI